MFTSRLPLSLLIGAVAGIATDGRAQPTEAAPTNPTHLLVVDKTIGDLVVLELETGTVTRRIAIGTGPHEVVLSPDGATAVVSVYGTAAEPGSALAFVDLESGAVRTLSTAPYTRPHGLAFVPGSNRLLVTAEAQDMLLEVDPEAPAIVKAHDVGQRLPHMVIAAPDGEMAFTANIVAGSFARVDLGTGQVRSAAVAEQAEGIALTADGNEVWVGSNAAHEVHVFDAATLERLDTIATCRVPIRVTRVRPGLMAVTCYGDDRVQLVDVASRAIVAEVALPDPRGDGAAPVGTLTTPDGATLYVATVRSGAVHEIDVEDAHAARLVRTFDVGLEPDGMALARLR
ncbi:MAG: hypothetical protein R6W77_17110 [Trueperaceae bacterium]